jgi:hypothetical protein
MSSPLFQAGGDSPADDDLWSTFLAGGLFPDELSDDDEDFVPLFDDMEAEAEVEAEPMTKGELKKLMEDARKPLEDASRALAPSRDLLLPPSLREGVAAQMRVLFQLAVQALAQALHSNDKQKEEMVAKATGLLMEMWKQRLNSRLEWARHALDPGGGGEMILDGRRVTRLLVQKVTAELNLIRPNGIFEINGMREVDELTSNVVSALQNAVEAAGSGSVFGHIVANSAAYSVLEAGGAQISENLFQTAPAIHEGPILQAEERVMIHGLLAFGDSDWKTLRDSYFPHREAHLLQSHYISRTQRHVPPNPLKDFRWRRTKLQRFTAHEDSLLKQGLDAFSSLPRSEWWSKIRQRFLPHRDESEIQRRWKRQRRQRLLEENVANVLVHDMRIREFRRAKDIERDEIPSDDSDSDGYGRNTLSRKRQRNTPLASPEAVRKQQFPTSSLSVACARGVALTPITSENPQPIFSEHRHHDINVSDDVAPEAKRADNGTAAASSSTLVRAVNTVPSGQEVKIADSDISEDDMSDADEADKTAAASSSSPVGGASTVPRGPAIRPDSDISEDDMSDADEADKTATGTSGLVTDVNIGSSSAKNFGPSTDRVDGDSGAERELPRCLRMGDCGSGNAGVHRPTEREFPFTPRMDGDSLLSLPVEFSRFPGQIDGNMWDTNTDVFDTMHSLAAPTANDSSAAHGSTATASEEVIMPSRVRVFQTITDLISTLRRKVT